MSTRGRDSDETAATARDDGAAGESAGRERILDEALRLTEAGRLGELTMAGVARAAGVSRQTAYVQFGTRAGLIVAMTRRRDEVNPRGEQLDEALALADPVEALLGLTRVLARWWQDIHPIAHALFAAALTDDGARAAWEDRMEHLLALARQAVDRLVAGDVLTAGWDARSAAEWLAGQLNPIGWVLQVEGAGWPQEVYEERLAATVRGALVAGG